MRLALNVGRGRLEGPWEQHAEPSAACSHAAEVLADSGILANTYGAEVLDEQNTDLDRCASSFTIFSHTTEFALMLT